MPPVGDAVVLLPFPPCPVLSSEGHDLLWSEARVFDLTGSELVNFFYCDCVFKATLPDSSSNPSLSRVRVRTLPSLTYAFHRASSSEEEPASLPSIETRNGPPNAHFPLHDGRLPICKSNEFEYCNLH